MSGSTLRNRVGIVTGADHQHIPYLDALLRSLRFFNDLELDISVVDFGFMPGDREYLGQAHGIRDIIPWNSVESRLNLMREVPGAVDRPNFPYVYATMRKLVLGELQLKEFMLWVDADCLVLGPVSEILGPDLPANIRAARNPRSDMNAQFIEKHDVIREALELSIRRKYSLPDDYKRSSFNSGVVLYRSICLKEFFDQLSEGILKDYGPYLWGDQAFLNICCSIKGVEVEDFGPLINVSCPPNVASDFSYEEHNGMKYPAISVAGRRALVYHFLHYKPVHSPFRKDPIQAESPAHRLFEAWRTFGDVPAGERRSEGAGRSAARVPIE